ncbi:armadillo repeat-containing protein 3 isoform X2 [Halichoeres trimaculatus]|uniref:armadillo repeat-containing protein 3 isoform X2 n=1 Tax=Halichoeres trimaculatus TaxID=147232 RepID=UPI003D9EC25B
MGKKGKKEIESPPKDTFEPVLVEGKTPETIVLLLSSTEEDILVKACEAIHTFAEKGDENKVSLLGLGALEPLCQLITHNNKLVRRNAFIALGVMSIHSDVKNVLKKMDAIPSIIDKLSLEEDIVVHEFATLCLAVLSVDFVCKVQISDNKGLPPLIQLLSSPDPDVKKNSLEIIFNLVQDYQSRVAVHELGGIPPLLELLKSDFPVIQHLVLRILQNVTIDEDSRNTFREEQGFEKLMDILSNIEFSDLHAEALQVVANCLSDSESLHLIQEDGGLTKLMEFILNPSTPEIQSSAVKCITRVAQSSENRGLLHKQNIEKVLVELLSVCDVSVQTSTCQAVFAMSFHHASKDSLRDMGAIPAVVQLLNDESLILREAATQALCSLTDSNTLNARAVYEAGGHELLVQQLSGSSPRMVANSVATLANMAEQEVIRCSILSHGTVQALAELLKSTNTQVLVNTTHCLAELTCDTEARAQLHRAGGLQPLVNLLHTHHRDLLHNACMVVSVCASDRTISVEMCKFGKKEEDDRQVEEAQPEPLTKKKMMDDVSLQLLAKKAKESILQLNDEQEQYAALARLVSSAMGGAVKMEKLHEFPWVLHISKLKFKFQSNVVPLGFIRKGIYCHRALLFKCLADCIGLSCTLVRGEYNRAWNEVILFDENPSRNRNWSQPCRYIVDLMHLPGSLLKAKSPAAELYQTI